MSKTVFIYCLKCPRTGDVRYIGKTDRLEKRFREHLCGSAKEKNRLGRWLRSLKGEKPVLVVLHEVGEHECWAEEERRYISCARAIGIDLVNTAEGGEGAPGHIQTPEHRAAISAALAGVKKSPEHCANISAAKTGKPIHSPEYRAAMSARQKGVPRSPETRAAISAAHTGVPLSPEHCAAISATHRGVPWSEARRAARKGVPWSPARRAAQERRKSTI